MTSFFFLTLEYAEIQYSGLAGYFQDYWNYVDSSQGIFYSVQIYLKLHEWDGRSGE